MVMYGERRWHENAKNGHQNHDQAFILSSSSSPFAAVAATAAARLFSLSSFCIRKLGIKNSQSL